jgi:lactoylglutathione lyase
MEIISFHLGYSFQKESNLYDFASCLQGCHLAAARHGNFKKERKMLEMQNIDHVGIRISDREKSVAFYELLGFEMIADGGYDHGHPLVMLHPSGININLLGPATARAGENVLMDEDAKYPGITHLAIKMVSAEDTEAFAVAQGIEITGRRSFRGTKTIFIRDPDRNVLELVGPGPSVATLIAEQVNEAKS